MKQRNFADYSWFNKVLLHACGALPIKTRNCLINFTLLLMPFVATGFLSFPAFYSLTIRWNKLKGTDRMDLVSEHIENIVGAIKVFVLLPKREKLYGLTRSCANLWKIVEREEDSIAVTHYAKRGLFLTYGFAANVFMAYLSVIITPIFMEFVLDANGTVLISKQLPYSAGLFHDNQKQFQVWWILQIFAGILTIVPIIAVDTATAFFVLHACAHMRLCQAFFQKISKDFSADIPLAIDAEEWPEKRKQIFKKIVACVKHHQNVLRYSDDVEEVFSPVVLVQTLLSISAICGYGYSLLVEEELKERVRYGLHMIGATLQLLLFCWPPDNLQDESVRVAEAAYDLPWYDWAPKEGKIVNMIVTKSQKPVTITVGGFSIISLETFSSILSTAFSMFTLMLRVLE